MCLSNPVRKSLILVSNDQVTVLSAIFQFLTGNSFFGQIWFKKKKKCQFKLKIITSTNLNIQNSMVMFTFYVYDWNIPLSKLDLKKSKLSVKLKFVIQTNSNMQNPMALFTFYVLEWKHPFWVNLVQKIKIVRLS